MRYLAAAEPEFEQRDQALAGDPVIPAPPAPVQNAFISMRTLLPCMAADVVDIDAARLEAALDGLAGLLPGIPKDILDDYVVHTAAGVHDVPVGTRFRVVMTEDTATLHNEARRITLWKRAPGFRE